jgi:hypothetical protein
LVQRLSETHGFVNILPAARKQLAQKAAPPGSKYRVPAAPVTEPLKSSARGPYQAAQPAHVNWFTIGSEKYRLV